MLSLNAGLASDARAVSLQPPLHSSVPTGILAQALAKATDRNLCFTPPAPEAS